MLIISEYSKRSIQSAGLSYLKKMEDSVKSLGIDLLNFEAGNIESLNRSLSVKRKKAGKVFWIGYVPNYKEYEMVYDLLKENGLELINNPKEFARSEYFDKFYPLIKSEKIESGIVKDIDSAKKLAEKLKYPLFIKGTIQSLKKYGWENCKATNEKELEIIFEKLQKAKDFSLGKVILRKFVDLKYKEIGGNGIPQAHEYRFFLLNNELLDYSYYWNVSNPYKISDQELKVLKSKVLNVSRKVEVPFISVDIGETKEEGWKIIEIGDGQFSDIRNISSLKFWNSILCKLKREE